MDEVNEKQTPDTENVEPDEEFELSHTDKLVGVFTEPAATFKKMSNFPPKVGDWLIPLVIMIILAIFANIVMMSNPKIKYQIVQKQIKNVEKRFDDMVKEGKMSREEAQQALDRTRDMMEKGGAAGMALQGVGIAIFSFIMFFIVSLAFFLVAKFGLKGEGSYSTAMSAYGLPYYIAMIQIIIMVIAAFALDKFMTGLSVAEFIGADKATLGGFLLSKIDLFSIWFYAVVAVGFAKMFKSETAGKYYGMVFGMWIGFGLIIFYLGKAVPFLNFLNQQ